MCLQHQVCIQSVTVVLDEDVSHQITLTREGDIIIGVNPVPVLPYVNGRSWLHSDQTEKFTFII